MTAELTARCIVQDCNAKQYRTGDTTEDCHKQLRKSGWTHTDEGFVCQDHYTAGGVTTQDLIRETTRLNHLGLFAFEAVNGPWQLGAALKELGLIRQYDAGWQVTFGGRVALQFAGVLHSCRCCEIKDHEV